MTSSSVHISLVAEKITHLGPLSVTNSLLTTWIVMLFLGLFAFLAGRKASLIPGKLQQTAEIIIEGLWEFFSTIIPEKIRTFFPLTATLFLFIICLNWVGLLPGMGTIGLTKIEEGKEVFVPLFRAGTADLNMTLALALTSMIVIQYTGFKTMGLKYLKKFFNFSGFVNFYVGILELISEFSKVISFSFRLFGNVFAGEVLLTVIAFLMPLIAPLPFLGLELFVGFIQALVFSMLTAVFLSVAASKAEH